MNPGDYINIPAHTKHRVSWTEPKKVTLWLCVFYTDDPTDEEYNINKDDKKEEDPNKKTREFVDDGGIENLMVDNMEGMFGGDDTTKEDKK